MRKINHSKYIFIWALILTMIASSFAFAATPSETTIADGMADGEAMGTLDGDLAGRTDKNAGKVSNYLLIMPKDTEIISRFALNKDSSLYQTNFITAYKTAYQIGYEKAYRVINIDEYTSPFDMAFENGKAAGTVQGQVSAMIDFTQSNKDDWQKTYKAFLAKGSLIDRYFLEREVLAYRNYFASGYQEGFMTAYIETFQTKNLETEIRNKNAKLVNMSENTVAFQEEYVHFDLGVLTLEMRTPMFLYIPAATIYEPTYISTFKTQNSFGEGNTALTPVSSKYTVAIWNNTGSVTLKKPVTLSFEYFGSERAGIYQWINNKWIYQYTTLSDGSLSIQIPAGNFKGGEYAIFIDETYKMVSDITFNWANKEIYTLMRRDIISDNALYSPNAKITRAQLAQMIYNSVAAKNPLTTTAPTIADASTLGYYKTAAEYMVGKKYLALDAKKNFTLNNTVSYAEMESMFSMMFLRDVKWTEIANKMLNEKFTKSPGTTNKWGAITKAEAAYAIYVFLK